MKHAARLVLVIGFAMFLNQSVYGKTLEFSSLKWKVRDDGKGSPAANFWRKDNVWVDEKGQLHLKIRKVGDVWTCAELQTTEAFLYGKFEFEIVGRIDELDKNIVLGLFKYPQEENRDGLDEIDIEFSRWGKNDNSNGLFTVYSDQKSQPEKSKNFSFALVGERTTHSFTRTSESVYFQSFHGSRSGKKFADWKFESDNISKIPMPIYLNFWLFRGQPPSDLQESEIIIKNVKFEKLG
jgi:Glycosyl hydrolases family 16